MKVGRIKIYIFLELNIVVAGSNILIDILDFEVQQNEHFSMA